MKKRNNKTKDINTSFGIYDNLKKYSNIGTDGEGTQNNAEPVRKWNAKVSPQEIVNEYEKGVFFNESINLYRDVDRNNRLYNGDQWGGVQAPHLDKVQDNIIRTSVNYYTSQINSDDIAVRVYFEDLGYPLGDMVSNIVQKEVENIMEHTRTKYKNRILLKNMALDGDMVLYCFFDIEEKRIRTEICENTDLIFGNPVDNEIQRQPYIIYKQNLLTGQAREMAKENGVNPDTILPDDNFYNSYASDKYLDSGNDYTSVYNKFWKQDGEVYFTRVTPTVVLKEPTPTGNYLYPIGFQNWENTKNNYHGTTPITGAAPNQYLINKMWAATAAYNINYAFPKVLYDKGKLPEGWNNDPTKALGCNGDPTNAIFSTFKPADMSEQIVAFITKLTEDTKNALGIYDVALGNVNPNNTSAIVATQKAAAAPLDIQKHNFYQMMEDVVNIWIDIMSTDYGVRNVLIESDDNQNSDPQYIAFDFSILKNLKYKVTIDIGESTYWSEITQTQTMDNLMNLQILPNKSTYLESIPKSRVRNLDKIIKLTKEQEAQEQMAQQQQMDLQQQQLQMQQQENSFKQELEAEEKHIDNANKQADLMKKLSELETIVNDKNLQYPENELADAQINTSENTWGW